MIEVETWCAASTEIRINQLAYIFGIVTAFVIATSVAQAGALRVRAREHYETIAVQSTEGDATYRGFTNTIDAWYEEPYRYSFGLAGSPLLARLYARTPPTGFSDTVRLVHLGVEGKVFPSTAAAGLFLRGGLYEATLASGGTAGRLTGRSELLGFGWEFDCGGIGLAPEMAWRWGQLSAGSRFTGTAPAIGVHFYRAL